MKWHRPQDNDERTLRRFALLPIWDDDDVYWLEWVDIFQQYFIKTGSHPAGWFTISVIGDSDK